ncbi:MAG: helix-turn-helix transcriptional regulator [Pseudomonadota bacterium]
MSRIWITGIAFVAGVAGIKTYLVLAFAMPHQMTNLTIVSGLFALFLAMTAGVAYFAFTQLRALMVRQRKEKLAPGSGEPVAKETVILRHAAEWGLSQAEADVAIFVAKGFSNSEIADMRGCAIATVKSQLGRIYSKSGLQTRYQLIAFVTDEVVTMAKLPSAAPEQRKTRKVLPLPGSIRKVA